MKRVEVELSPNNWPPHVRAAFEAALFPLFSAGWVEGLQMAWSTEHEMWEHTYIWRAWDADIPDREHAIHKMEYVHRSIIRG